MKNEKIKIYKFYILFKFYCLGNQSSWNWLCRSDDQKSVFRTTALQMADLGVGKQVHHRRGWTMSATDIFGSYNSTDYNSINDNDNYYYNDYYNYDNIDFYYNNDDNNAATEHSYRIE